jgi:cytochrome c1
MLKMKKYRSALFLGVMATAAAGYAAYAYAAGGETVEIPRQEWTFAGMTGHFDRAQLQRGFKVYYNVCKACHGMSRLSYRNLSQPGGPEFSAEQVAAIAAEAEVTDGPNEDGEMFTRPGKPTDRFVWAFPNKQAAAAANGGALPPDLSLIVKARTVERNSPWYMFPVNLASDLATQYQEQGADYTFALLMGYADEPPSYVRDDSGRLKPLPEGETNDKAEKCASVTPGVDGAADVCNPLGSGMNYNKVYSGHQIAMAAPLSDGIVDYEDGTEPTMENYARDVTAFLAWAAEPTMEQRKKLGLQVLVYLVILTVLLYLSKKALWRKIDH